MSLIVNGRFLSQPLTGVQRVAHQVTERLINQRPDLRILAPANAMEWPRGWPVERVGATTGYLWEQSVLPRAARGATLLSLCNLGPMAHRRQIVMIHDAATFDTPANYGRAMRLAYRVLLPILGRNARRVLTVSEFSKSRLVHHGVAKSDRIVVAPNGIDHVLGVSPGQDVLGQFGLRQAGYVLAVGSTSANKNLSLVVAGLKRLGTDAPPLVLVGGGRSGGVFARDRGLDDSKVLSLGHVSDEDLMGLYANALCLAFPSRYEGFGLPPLEAMALGCPAIVSDQGSLPEICGDAALVCRPDDDECMAAHIRSLTTDQGLRSQLIGLGRDRAAAFTWRRSLEVITHVIAEVEA